MSKPWKPEIFFSFFMFTADLKPDDTKYTSVLIQHLHALTEMGYVGFDLHIAAQPRNADRKLEFKNYKRLKKAFDQAGFKDTKFTTNVGTTQTFDPTSPYKEQRKQALTYLKSRVNITSELGGESIMSGPFLYPYGVFPISESGEPIWSDALQDWMKPRYHEARSIFEDLVKHASKKGVSLSIEPVKSWETPPPNMVSEVLDFLNSFKNLKCGLTIDTAQVLMESHGPAIFKKNVADALLQNRLNYVHISAPDRGAVHDSWIPWDLMLGEIEPKYQGPYLIEVFNAIPPFDSSMRMARRRFWRPGEDPPTGGDSAYDVAKASLKELQNRLKKFKH
jgi:sugar phosphate isomerase/epimerase